MAENEENIGSENAVTDNAAAAESDATKKTSSQATGALNKMYVGDSVAGPNAVIQQQPRASTRLSKSRPLSPRCFIAQQRQPIIPPART